MAEAFENPWTLKHCPVTRGATSLKSLGFTLVLYTEKTWVAYFETTEATSSKVKALVGLL